MLPTTPPTRRGRRPRWTVSCLVASIGVGVLLSICFGPTSLLKAQEDEQTAASREYQIKAAFLYQFGRYVEWPAKSFSGPKSPFVIGVLDQDPLIPDLEQIAKIKKIQDRPIQIRRFASAADIRQCNILYLSPSLAPEAQADVAHKMSGQGILLVGDADKFLDWGGTMRFVVEDNKIRVEIARKAAEHEGLTISAKLLQVARVVD